MESNLRRSAASEPAAEIPNEVRDHPPTFALVGPNGLEPSTSSVSRKRSNQLSYGPIDGMRPRQCTTLMLALGASDPAWYARGASPFY